MQRRRNALFLLMAVMLLLSLAACQAQSPAATSAPSESAVQSPTQSQPPTSLPSTSTASAPTASAPTASAPTASSPAASEQPASSPTVSAAASTGTGCTVVSYQPVLRQGGQSLIPPVSAKDWVQGPDNAPITLLEYSDFQ